MQKKLARLVDTDLITKIDKIFLNSHVFQNQRMWLIAPVEAKYNEEKQKIEFPLLSEEMNGFYPNNFSLAVGRFLSRSIVTSVTKFLYRKTEGLN